MVLNPYAQQIASDHYESQDGPEDGADCHGAVPVPSCVKVEVPEEEQRPYHEYASQDCRPQTQTPET